MENFFQGYIEQTFDQIGELLETCRAAQKQRHIYLFGCGGIGVLTLDTLRRNGVEPYAFCANDAAAVGTAVRGLKVVSFDEMLADEKRLIILSTLTSQYIEEMARQLRQHGVFEYHYAFGISLSDRRKTDLADFGANYRELETTLNRLDDELSRKVFCASINAKINNTLIADKNLVSKQPIFLDDVISFDKNEVYYDVGAYIGDNALRFLERVPEARVLCFEPDPVNYGRCAERAGADPRVSVYHSGCGETTQTLTFVSRNAPNTTLVSQAQSASKAEDTFDCDIIRLDDIADVPTFISMDIEGAELSALKGAKETIVKHKPKLAIAIYHNARDYWEVPAYILGLRPDYRFYARTSHFGGESCVGYFL